MERLGIQLNKINIFRFYFTQENHTQSQTDQCRLFLSTVRREILQNKKIAAQKK
jgi:hypothetical protein